MLCDCHQRLRLPQMSPEMKTVSNADGAVVGIITMSQTAFPQTISRAEIGRVRITEK